MTKGAIGQIVVARLGVSPAELFAPLNGRCRPDDAVRTTAELATSGGTEGRTQQNNGGRATLRRTFARGMHRR